MDTGLRVVGIDPGTTSGVAVLDLDGELVDYTSRRDFSKDRIIEFIVDAGKPLLVGADVAPAPSLVEEVASNTGSVLVAPETDLDSGYKQDIVDDLPVGAGDAHVRDAAAAAEYARREHADQVAELRRRAREEGVEQHLGDVIELVVNGGLSTAAAIAEVDKVEPEQEDRGERRGSGEPDWQQVAERRQRRIDVLESKVANLEEHVEELEAGDGDGDGDAVPGDEELRRRNRRIRELRDEAGELRAAVERLEAERDRLREAVRRLGEGWRWVPRVDDLSTAGHGAVFIDAYGGGDIAAPVETVVTAEPAEELAAEGLAVVDVDGVERLVETEDGYVIHPGELDGGDEERFMEWLESYRQR
ncbi:MAG: DUF460 domain-containing protein [Candidatus Nanohaloarchaea archaeon]|nr:DUF460 domain-containing protein [Candidatus Nanohaloarchaea archaeon]